MTSLFNPENERLKRRYLQYAKEAKRLGSASLDRIAASIDRFQVHSTYKPFRKFHIEQAIAFKRHLESARKLGTGKLISASFKRAVLTDLKGFFLWLADQNGFRRRLRYSDCEYFNTDNRTMALSNARQRKSYPSLEQVEHVLRTMCGETAVERRNRALIAFTLLTGARVAALASAKVRHVDLVEDVFYQDAREVRTKFSKSFETWFFPVSDLALDIFKDYYAWLTEEILFGPGDPLFPKTEISRVPGIGFQATGLSRQAWQSTNGIRDVFKRAFECSGLAYFHPHCFRDTLGAIGKKRCKTFDELQAWAQNLGHDNAMTTIRNYGPVTSDRQREIIRTLRSPGPSI